MNCPKCNAVELKKKEFNSPSFCNSCGGMWLNDFNLLISSSETIIHEENKPSPNEKDKKTGLCPEGHGIMIRAKIEIENPFYLEKCLTCGGIWFDKGEWEQIIASNFVENLNLIWLTSWQSRQRKQKSREDYLETNRSMLGQNTFQLIMELSQELKAHPEKERAMALLKQELLDKI